MKKLLSFIENIDLPQDHSEAIDVIPYKDCTIYIYPDECPDDPRTWDNLGTMACIHHRYNLGDKHTMTVEEIIELMKQPDVISLPLYLYEHSGITMNTTGFECPWDSGQVGFIYVFVHNAKCPRVKNERIAIYKERIKKILEDEVKIYDQYLTGEVYGFEILNVVGASIDSCWGFFGDPEKGLIPECKAIIDNL